MQKKRAFTLVELVVSVTIISILSTIWFMWFVSYLSSVRDTSRTTNLVEIYDTLIQKNITGTLPMPDDYIEITSNGQVIAYQWYAWKTVLSSLWLPDSMVDPKDDTYYSYYLTKNKKYSQVMAFLEDEVDEKEAIFFETIDPIFTTEINYQDRTPLVYGNKLWILTTNSNQPIHEVQSIQTAGTLDVSSTTEELVARLENTEWSSWTWSTLVQLEALSKKWGKNCSADWVEIICETNIPKEQTLEDIKILIEEASALVYSESVIAWVETEAVATISWLGEDLTVSYGYPITPSSTRLVAYWSRLITLNDKFTYTSTSGWVLIVYEIALADMVFTTGTCAVTYNISTWFNQMPIVTLYPCL
jgi:prepilin-type N-terminal cleavage/methylation domain-containing protein